MYDPNEKVLRIAEYIYNLYELGMLDFDITEESLNTLNSLCENTWIAIPEPHAN
jgi:hypothetical protein